MNAWTKRLLVLVMVMALVSTTAGLSALAQDQNLTKETTAEEMIADLILLRPLGIVSTAVGSVFFIVSLPFSGPSRTADEAFFRLVADPATFTFARPLGNVDF